MTDAKPTGYGAYDAPHRDLREWIERVEQHGELMRVEGVDWNLEMGSVAEMIYHAKPDRPPAILFEKIPGFPDDFRVLSGATNSPRRLALTLGLDLPDNPLDVVRAYRKRLESFEEIPPREVNSGPIMENVDRDDDVDLYKFPIPFLHEEDGGRYFGTGDLVVMRDPDSDWVNLGTYRAMVHDKNTMGLWMSPGKHGRHIRDKYFAQGKPCPVAISVGHDPLLFLSAGNEVDFESSEFAHAGGHRGRPFDVTASELHGLPIPADAEIVVEGDILPDEKRPEGPFGEWTGYYASKVREDYVVRIRRVYYRDNPIHTMARPGRPPSDYSLSKCVVKSAMIWEDIENAGLRGVQGVWCHEQGGGRLFNVVSIKQDFPGHAKQALLLTAGALAANYLGRFVIVVDHDIDPSNLQDVTWAMASRCDPVDDIDIIRKAWSGPLDPRKKPGDNFNSRALIDACRPFDWIDDFPLVAEASPEEKRRTLEKFGHLLDRL
jgi:UbiD family decarboxylase